MYKILTGDTANMDPNDDTEENEDMLSLDDYDSGAELDFDRMSVRNWLLDNVNDDLSLEELIDSLGEDY